MGTRTVIVLSFVAAISSAGTAAACEKHRHAKQVKPVSPDELARWRESGDVVVVDVNNAATRGKMGVIPGAMLVRDYARFDPKVTLGTDKTIKVVFYCMRRCGSAWVAAERAVAAGFRHVYVLSGGISDWIAAGQPTSKPAS